MSEKAETVFEELRRQTNLLATISLQLNQILQSNAPLSPNYRRRLSEYNGFDWASIGATVIAKSGKDVIEVEWSGHRFDRAAGRAYGGDFVIFSRPSPEWTQTNKVYYTLIRFADYNDTPLVAQDQPSKAQPEPRPVYRATEEQKRQAGIITPLDVQATTPPAETRKPGQTQPDNPRQAFYKLGGDAVAAGRLAFDKFNEMVRKASKEGFGVALQELQGCLA